MRKIFALLFLPLFLGGLGSAAGQQLPCPLDDLNASNPTKTIIIYNNSDDHTIYPMISIGIHREPNPRHGDLWMQAQFEPCFADKNPYPQFNTNFVYRAYINKDRGIPPHGSVTVTVPLFTQLKEVTKQDVGEKVDQFIDWWSAGRIYLFDGGLALKASEITNGSNIEPKPVTPLSGTKAPTCEADGGCVVDLFTYNIDPPSQIPFQLNEYTFGSAHGPPLEKRPASIELNKVNYNVSSLDSVYLPVAMGALDPDPNQPELEKRTRYVGSVQSIAKFRERLSATTNDGKIWPYFVPAYFGNPKDYPTLPVVYRVACSLEPLKLDQKYGLPKLPGTNVLLAESFNYDPNSKNVPMPPALSSNPPQPLPNGSTCVSAVQFNPKPAVGSAFQGVENLWASCMNGGGGNTCAQLDTVIRFFKDNYNQTCASKGAPSLLALAIGVYGWVPISYNSCVGPPLKDTQSQITFKTAFDTYCRLQYNYLQTGLDPKYWFNPYTWFIHKDLKSSAYAFSIDDKLSFRSLEAKGLILAIGGDHGLQNKTPTELPTIDTYATQCKSG